MGVLARSRLPEHVPVSHRWARWGGAAQLDPVHLPKAKGVPERSAWANAGSPVGLLIHRETSAFLV